MQWLKRICYSIPVFGFLMMLVMCQQLDENLLKGARQIAAAMPQELNWEIFEISGEIPEEIFQIDALELAQLFKNSEASSPPGKRRSDEVVALFNLSVFVLIDDFPKEFCYSVRIYKFELKKVWLDLVPPRKKCGTQVFGYINRKLYSEF